MDPQPDDSATLKGLDRPRGERGSDEREDEHPPRGNDLPPRRIIGVHQRQPHPPVGLLVALLFPFQTLET